MYEKRLKNEFDRLQKLQTSEVKDIVEIFYQERNERKPQWKSIMTNPKSPLYPNRFKVTYHFPIMYVGPDKIVKNWCCTIIFNVPENILMNMGSTMGVQIENGSFKDGEVPFNHHVKKSYICTGSAWTIAQQGNGINYFVMLIGSLLNMDKFMLDTKSGHLNDDAYNYWINKRNMKPINKINWPFDLNMRSNTKKSSLIRFGKQQLQSKPQILFGQKKSVSSPPKITFGKRN